MNGRVSRGFQRGGGLRAAYQVGRAVGKAYQGYKKGYQRNSTNTKGQDDQKPLYGATFTSKVSYKKKNIPKKYVKAQKRQFRTFINNSMKLQNASNYVGSNDFFTNSAVNKQQWYSLDLLNIGTIQQYIDDQFPSGSTATSLRDFQLWLKTFSMRFYITNSGAATAIVDMYYVIPKRDIGYTEVGSPTLPTNGNVMVSGVLALASTDTGADPFPVARPDRTDLGWSPFMYSNFCRQYTIKRIRTVVLPIGATFEERDTIMNRKLNLAMLGGQLPGIAGSGLPSKFYNRNLSKMILFRFRGMPDSANGAAATGLHIAWEETACCKIVQTRPGNSTLVGSA